MSAAKKLHEWLPYDYKSGTVDNRINSHLLDTVTCDFDGGDVRWPGTHRNVLNWCIVDTGYAVGWNESPSIGWSFVIKKIAAQNIKEYVVLQQTTAHT